MLWFVGGLFGLILAIACSFVALAGLASVVDPEPDTGQLEGMAVTAAGTVIAAGGWALLRWAWRRAFRRLGAVVALIVIATAVAAAVSGIGVSVQNQDPGDRTAGMAAVAASAAVLAGGWLLLASAWPAGARFFAGLAGFVLLPVGYVLFLMAMVLPYSEDPNVYPVAAAVTAAAGAILCFVAGLALVALGIRWARSPAPRRRWGNVLKVGAMVYGTQIFFQGLWSLALSLPMLVPAWRGEGTRPEELTYGVAYGVLGLFLGTALTYHSVSALMGAPSGTFRPSRWLWLGLAIPVALVGAAAALLSERGTGMVVPLAFTVAFLVPGLTVLFLFGRVMVRRSGGAPGLPTWRDVFAVMGWGAVGGTSIAGFMNQVTVLGAAVAALALTGGFEGVRNFDGVVDSLVDTPDLLGSTGMFVLLLVWIAVLVPLVEEAAKALGVAFRIRSYASPASAFLSGAASGAGFGTMEALFYGLGGLLFGDPVLWAVLMLARAGGSTMHALATGTTSLGLYYAAHEGRRRLRLRNYGLAVGLHAVWNGGLTVLAFALFGDALGGEENRSQAILSFTYVGVLSVLSFCALLVVSRRLARGLAAVHEPAVEDLPALPA